MRAAYEIAPRAVKARAFPFLKQPVDMKKWSKDVIYRYLSKWTADNGLSTSQAAAPVVESLASEYRRLILADVAMEGVYEADEVKADSVVKLAAVIDKTEIRIRRAWETLGVFPLVRKDAKRPEAATGKIMDFSRKTTAA